MPSAVYQNPYAQGTPTATKGFPTAGSGFTLSTLHGGTGGAVGTPPNPTTVPNVQVNANGLLELPYDQSYGQGVYDAINETNDTLLGIKTQEDQQGLDYQRSLRDASGAYGQQQRTTLNRVGSRGALFSSQYGTGVVNDATAYANQVGDIEADNTGKILNFNAQRNAATQALNNRLGALAQANTDKLSEDAGNLGYGQSKTEPKNDAKDAAYKTARRAYDAYRAQYTKAQQMTARAKQTASKSDDQAARRARAAAESLRTKFKALNQKYKDYS